MVSTELLEQINARLKQITGLFTKDFGGLDVILIGDLRQLPPVKATPIFKQIKRKITGETPWRKFKQFELKQVMRQENRQFSEILTKIGDGNILTEEELKVMESRFITKEEAQSVCPEGIRLLFTNAAVNAYNYSVLNSVDDKIISVASDVITGCHNPEQENFVRQKLHKMKTDETGGLPYELILVLNRPYMITNNIDVADRLSNGTVGKLYHVERDENGDIIRIWLKFPKSCGRKQAKKLRNLSARLNLDDDAVPITSQTSSVALNNNKTIIAKRKHFPLVSALAMTIHKSQGGTYDAIVYEYDHKHPRELVYVALSRVTKIEGLFMVTKENTEDSWKFWIGRSGIPLNTSESDKHLKRSTKTHMKNEEPIHIPDFNFVASYKRPEVPAAGVAIYQHTQDTSHIVTSYMDIHTKFTRGIGVNVPDIGEICVARCNSENGQYILMVAVYISPEKSMQQIEQFLFENLMIYTKEGSELLEKRFGEKFDDIPMILSGDFNINFADDKNLSLIEFLNETLGLTMSNDRKVSTTNYHKPIVSFLEYNEMIERTDNLSIVEINDDNDVNNENNVQT
ncbi:ATP-dependent DNA helicase [Trichonephila clavipes]|nr:ATP-dependent DNA helicase [Trichonephila clavipes]